MRDSEENKETLIFGLKIFECFRNRIAWLDFEFEILMKQRKQQFVMQWLVFVLNAVNLYLLKLFKLLYNWLLIMKYKWNITLIDTPDHLVILSYIKTTSHSLANCFRMVESQPTSEDEQLLCVWWVPQPPSTVHNPYGPLYNASLIPFSNPLL